MPFGPWRIDSRGKRVAHPTDSGSASLQTRKNVANPCLWGDFRLHCELWKRRKSSGSKFEEESRTGGLILGNIWDSGRENRKKAKRARPGKNERDYLKLVLITKPPFDYQYDNVIERILDESKEDIRELARLIYAFGHPRSPVSSHSWEARQRNIELSLHSFQEKNKQFFRDFWDN